jgi:hypothetical protein
MRRHLKVCLSGELQQRPTLTEAQNAQNARAAAARRAKIARARPHVEDWCSGEVAGLTLMWPLLELCCVGIEGVMLTTEMEVGRYVVFRCADYQALDVVDFERHTALASTTRQAHVEVLQHVQFSPHGACVGAARVESCVPHAMLVGSFFITFGQVVLLK